MRGAVLIAMETDKLEGEPEASNPPAFSKRRQSPQ